MIVYLPWALDNDHGLNFDVTFSRRTAWAKHKIRHPLIDRKNSTAGIYGLFRRNLTVSLSTSTQNAADGSLPALRFG